MANANTTSSEKMIGRGSDDLGTYGIVKAAVAVIVFAGCVLLLAYCSQRVSCRRDPTRTKRYREKRKQLIKETMIVWKWSIDGSSTCATAENNGEDEENKITNTDIREAKVADSEPQPSTDVAGGSSGVIPEGSDHSDSCAICMTPFEDLQEVCRSNNSKCKHVFHRECMSSWLVKHVDCPICRQVFLLQAS